MRRKRERECGSSDVDFVDRANRKPYALYFDKPSLTVQSFADECDINQIVARACAGQDIGHVNSRVAQYGDFSNVPNYMDALALVNRANGMFASMSAQVRERFSNDPAKMIAFLQDPGNRDEAIKLGLVVKPVGEVVAPGPTGPGGADTPKAG